MYTELTIGGVKVPLLSNAATPLRYKQFFHKDILKEMQGASDDSAKITDSLPELTFIMAKQAQAKAGKCDMNMLKESDFIDWLEMFDAYDIPMASEEIVSVYLGNALSDVEAKKKENEDQKE